MKGTIRTLFKLTLIMSVSLDVALGFSRWDVSPACNSMTPGHITTGAQSSPAPYGIHITPEEGGTYLVTVYGKNKEKFKGFLLQARDPEDQRVGTFLGVQSKGKLLECGNTKSAAQHKNSDDKTQVTARWSPDGYTGPLNFRATIVKSYFQYWTKVQSQEMTV